MSSRAARAGADSTRATNHPNGAMGLMLPPELLEAVARRIAELVVADLGGSAEQWVDADGAAAHVGMSRKALYGAAAEGRLPAHRIGKTMRFRLSELDAALEAS